MVLPGSLLQGFCFLFFLTYEEKADIDSYAVLENPDALELQVLVRSGSEFKVHPDQIRQWTNAGGSFATECPGLCQQFLKNQTRHFFETRGLGEK